MSTKRPTAKDVIFAKVYAETGDAVKAYKAAYGEERAGKIKYLSSTASQKLKSPVIKSLVEDMQQGMRAQFILLAPDALNNLWDLANSAASEKVRLEANREILYGAGLRPIEEVKLTSSGLFGGATVDDIRSLIKQHIEEQDEEKSDALPVATESAQSSAASSEVVN